MENNLKKWFTAAADAEPIIEVEEVVAMINKAPYKGTLKSTDNYIKITATLVFVIAILGYWLNIPLEEQKQTEKKRDTLIRIDIPEMKIKPEMLKSRIANSSLKSIEHLNITNDSQARIVDCEMRNNSNDFFSPGFNDAKATEVPFVSVDNFQDRILYLTERELEKLDITFIEGVHNHYHKTYSVANSIKATQLRSFNDSFYFTKGYPGQNYFIKPWESNFYPLFLTDSLGNHQQNFHFQDCPENMDHSTFVDSLRNDFLKSYKDLLPVAIRSSKNGKLSILWYEPSNGFFKCVSKRTKILVDSYRIYEGLKDDE